MKITRHVKTVTLISKETASDFCCENMEIVVNGKMDSDLQLFLRFGNEALNPASFGVDGHMVGIRFCPWCGKHIKCGSLW